MPHTQPAPPDPTARPGGTAPRARSRRRAALAAAATAALLALTATACGPDANSAAASGGSAGSGQNKAAGPHLPDGAPTSLDDLKRWKDGGWKDWGRWAHRAQDFINPIIKNHWESDRLARAKAAPDINVNATAAGGGYGANDPTPPRVTAQEVARPYHRNMAPVGKIFFDSPKGPMVCSGTVVEDPAHPGKSDLVWTAGHCVHSGRQGGWMRNIIFVPSYNDNGVPMSQVGRTPAQQVTPYGKFWADWITTSGEWIDRGSETDAGSGAPYDYAVLHVRPENGGGRSLQETVGAAAQVWFNPPPAGRIGQLQAFGYPAAAPYDGARMMSCLSPSGRLAAVQGAPPMDRIGCSMTGGSSGGGWFVNRGGKLTLVSNTSVGNPTEGWQAGPYLGPVAQRVFTTISNKFAGR
ncbi:trypsin-like serine peptidase [Streptomyces sp. NPDC090442]|uniref:trypsin-like serine peptidase n=1 Tax=Streptomyces sp. NPDC090442 TaxID=3365962 RepID=UPI00382FD4B3